LSTEFVKVIWIGGAGPKASQNLIVATKAHAALMENFPDIEDVKAGMEFCVIVIKNTKRMGITDEMICKTF
jgi:MoxR-like ATPase